MMTFGEKLRNLRKSRFLTQQKLADELKISQSAVAAYENGIREPDFATIKRIADYFFVSASSLMPSEDDDTSEFVQQVADSIANNQKLRMLFDKARYMSESDIDAVLTVVSAIQKDIP